MYSVSSYRIILSGGGTGGHIYPAIAIARECEARWPGSEILFVGANGRMEMEKVPQAGYAIEGLNITGMQRSLNMKLLKFPFQVLGSFLKARKILKSFKPDVAIGTGGFASGPLLYAASGTVPTLIQEQNSYAGITNKLLGKRVDKICVAYDNMQRYFPASKLEHTGNPVRPEIVAVPAEQAAARTALGLDPDRKTLFVMGGSLGARRVNELIAAHAEALRQDVQILWQCGKLYSETYESFNAVDGVKVQAFIQDMPAAYAAADFIISRAGAGAMSELALVGKPALLIPSPHVAEDHQTKNAQAYALQDAALFLTEEQLDLQFEPTWANLLHDESLQNRLSHNIKQMARPDATQRIVDEIEKLLAS